jgi:hypothetical protein
MTTNVLAQKAVLASLTISQWSARRFDRKITDETNRRHNADADAGRYNKLLIEKKHLEEINAASSHARSIFAEMTLPWLADGTRMLPSKLYMDFTSKMRRCRIDFDAAADKFERHFPEMVRERKAKLNGMFDESDYPEACKVRSLFAFDTKFMDVPTGDFRVALSQDTIDDMRADVEAKLKEVLDTAMIDVRSRIVDVVGKMAERLRAYDKEDGSYFKDSLVGNVRDLCNILPAMNLNNDPALSAIINRMRTELATEEPKRLREEANIRHTVARSAERILSDVKSFMA